jgi:hypothetical protein
MVLSRGRAAIARAWHWRTDTGIHGCRKADRRLFPGILLQLAALERSARDKGAAFGSLDLATRRTILDEAFTRAGLRGLPPRPSGQHVVADLMAFYFRSTEANDDCYRALIQREVCRPIQITTRRPAPIG